jgi:hypothetical protein
MGLQIRVRHALGQRVIELPDRGVDRPLVVGRAANVEVQVPSAAVAPKHCALFLHDGYWAVRHLAAAGGGTFVNGEAVEGSRYLQIGDVIALGADPAAPTIGVDPAAAAAGRTGYAGADALQAAEGPDTATPQVPAVDHGFPAPAAPAPVSYAAPVYAQPGVAQPGYAQPGYAPSGYAAPVAGQAPGYAPAAGYSPAAGYAPPADYADRPAESADDGVDYQPPAATAGRLYTGRRRQSAGAGVVVFMVLAVLAVGGLVWFVLANRQPAVTVIQKPDQLIVTKVGPPTATKPSETDKPTVAAKPYVPPAVTRTASGERRPNVVGGPPTPTDTPYDLEAGQPKATGVPIVRPDGPPEKSGADKPGTGKSGVAGPAMPPGDAEPGMDPIAKPSTGGKPTVAKGGGDEGMDMVRKPAAPAGGGGDEGMDMVRKPGGGGAPAAAAAAPAIPPGEDPETLSAADANSFETMQKLAARTGKESFAVLRFEEFKKANPGKHEAEIDGFVDKKMDRIWWERVAQLMTKAQRIDADMAKAKLELLDVTNPDQKKKLIEGYKKMETDKPLANKMLRDTMRYDSSEVPDLSNESMLASLAGKRDKAAYENWKKATIVQIKANKGKLPWADEL